MSGKTVVKQLRLQNITMPSPTLELFTYLCNLFWFCSLMPSITLGLFIFCLITSAFKLKLMLELFDFDHVNNFISCRYQAGIFVLPRTVLPNSGRLITIRLTL